MNELISSLWLLTKDGSSDETTLDWAVRFIAVLAPQDAVPTAVVSDEPHFPVLLATLVAEVSRTPQASHVITASTALDVNL